MLPNNLRVLKNYDKVSFEYMKEEIDYKYEFNDDIVINNYVLHKVNNEDSDSNYICRLNFDDIKLPLYIRNRRTGDRIYIMNLDGSKKVKDVFIDSKIDLNKRNSYPILVDSNDNILWIPGIKKSKYVKKKDNKYDIIIKYEKIKEEK